MLVGTCQQTRRQAFSLVELMVVVILIGILAAMIIPEMKGTYEDALLRSASRDLVNAFSVAYSRAVSVNTPHRVRLDPRTGRYVVEMRARNPRQLLDYVPLPDVPGAQGELDERLSIKIRRADQSGLDAREPGPPLTAPTPGPESPGSGEAIQFYPDGTADAVEVVLRDRAGFGLALRLNPITARVRVLELPRQ